MGFRKMAKLRIPIIITVILVLITVAAFCILLTSKSLRLTNAEMVNSLIAIFACLGALISATFVIYSYLMTNYAFIQSQKPYLLIQVVKGRDVIEGNRTVPTTVIHYTNITDNTFLDLTMDLRVSVLDKEIDISDLFTPNIYMAARDKRNRTFKPIELLLNKCGININAKAQADNPVILKVGYKYSFNKKV